jgi:hypothetical protein
VRSVVGMNVRVERAAATTVCRVIRAGREAARGNVSVLARL